MTFFYDLNKRLANLAIKQDAKQLNESTAMAEKADYSAKKAAAGKDIGKPGKMFSKIAKTAGKEYGSKERGEKVASQRNGFHGVSVARDARVRKRLSRRTVAVQNSSVLTQVRSRIGQNQSLHAGKLPLVEGCQLVAEPQANRRDHHVMRADADPGNLKRCPQARVPPGAGQIEG
jgi:hypothetical protein